MTESAKQDLRYELSVELDIEEVYSMTKEEITSLTRIRQIEFFMGTWFPIKPPDEDITNFLDYRYSMKSVVIKDAKLYEKSMRRNSPGGFSD